jgi:hypothetical protein
VSDPEYGLGHERSKPHVTVIRLTHWQHPDAATTVATTGKDLKVTPVEMIEEMLEARHGFFTHEMFDAPVDDIITATAECVRRAEEAHEDERNMAIAYFWYASALRVTRGGGASVGRVSFAERLWSHVERRGPTECWPSDLYRMRGGRTKIRRGGRGGPLIYTHVAVYELLVGPVPEGCELHHRCENGNCCNPAHLVALTRYGHAQEHRPPTCRLGHPLIRRNDGRGVCLACDARRQREYQARKRGRP